MIIADRRSGTAVEKMGDDEGTDLHAGFEFLEWREKRGIAGQVGRSAEEKFYYSKLI